jgi:hypothetical protein
MPFMRVLKLRLIYARQPVLLTLNSHKHFLTIQEAWEIESSRQIDESAREDHQRAMRREAPISALQNHP